MNKNLIKQKISEALSASLGDWEKDFEAKFVKWTSSETLSSGRAEMNQEYRILNVRKPEKILLWIRAEKAKVESEIKSALETIDLN